MANIAFSRANPRSKIPSSLALELGQKPAWLLSNYSDLIWLVKDIGGKPDRKIFFDISLADGTRLSQHTNLIESIKRIVYGVRTGPLMSVESGQVQAQVANNLFGIVRWMNFEAIDRFEDLRAGDLEAFCSAAIFGWNNVFNTESRLVSKLQDIFIKANILDEDSPAERVTKSMQHCPVRRNNKANAFFIDRIKILDDIGIGIGAVRGKGSARVCELLDEAGHTFGMYLPPRIQQRLSIPSLDEEDEPLTWIALARVLDTFRFLHSHRRYLDDALSFVPFAGISIAKKAQLLGKQAKRTRSIPIKQGATIIERSVRWVIDYADDIIRLSESCGKIYVEERNRNKRQLLVETLLASFSPNMRGPCDPWPITRVSRRSDNDFLVKNTSLTLNQAIKFLQTACAVVIAAFSARRAAEISGLRAGCVEYSDGRQWINIFIHKTLQQEDVVPVPELVGKAVSVLESLSSRARLNSIDQRIFQFSSEYAEWSADTAAGNLAKNMEQFGLFLDVPDWKGSRWIFKPHQFRRFFAILYAFVYELGDFGALSYHLRHFDPEMTRRYVRDDELGQILAYTKKEHTASIIQNAVLGNVQVSGAVGTRMVEAGRRLYENMAKKVQVVNEDRFAQRIIRMVERQGLDLNATPWGYCACQNSSDAPCLIKEEVNPTGPMDYRLAAPQNCHNCIFSARTPDFIPIWKISISEHKAIVENDNVPSLLKQASQQKIEHINHLIQELEPA